MANVLKLSTDSSGCEKNPGALSDDTLERFYTSLLHGFAAGTQNINSDLIAKPIPLQPKMNRAEGDGLYYLSIPKIVQDGRLGPAVIGSKHGLIRAISACLEEMINKNLGEPTIADLVRFMSKIFDFSQMDGTLEDLVTEGLGMMVGKTLIQYNNTLNPPTVQLVPLN